MTRIVLALLCLVFLLIGPVHAQSCDDLWHKRNAIYANKGYCFKTDKAKKAFGERCFAPYGKLSRSEEGDVTRIKKMEKEKKCDATLIDVDTNETTPRQIFETIYDECGNKWGFPGAIATCLLENDKTYGGSLTVVYNLLLERETTERANALRESQRAWLKYQKKKCEYASAIAAPYGSWAPLAKSSCLLKSTLERAILLMTAYNSEREYDW